MNTQFGAEIENYGSNSICVDAARSLTTSCGTYIPSRSQLPICISQVTYTVNNNSKYILQLQSMFCIHTYIPKWFFMVFIIHPKQMNHIAVKVTVI